MGIVLLLEGGSRELFLLVINDVPPLSIYPIRMSYHVDVVDCPTYTEKAKALGGSSSWRETRRDASALSSD